MTDEKKEDLWSSKCGAKEKLRKDKRHEKAYEEMKKPAANRSVRELSQTNH